MPLPYKTLKPVETVEVGGFTIRKRGSLTVAEEHAMRGLEQLIESNPENLTPLQSDLVLKQHVITILIQSRLDRDWDLAKTQASVWPVEMDGETVEIEPDMEMLDDLFNFFMAEQRRHKSIEDLEAEPQSAKKKK